MSAPVAEAAPLLQRLGDRLNPLVVKEVRQGLRTRVFWVCFALMLVACLMLSLTAYANARDAGFSTHGRGYFFAYYVCLGLVHFFIIPYSAYRSLAREREDETWVLLVLTGLGPRRILRGKVTSFLVQAALYASAVGPFLLFSYYLNGIDLPSILLVLVLGGAWLTFLTVLGVCAATLADGRMGRAFVHFLVLGVLGMGLFQGLGGAFGLSEEGERLLRDDDFIALLVGGVWAMLGYGWLLFEAAAARLSLPTEDYARGPRRAMALHLLLSGVLVWVLWEMQNRMQPISTVAAVGGSLHLVATGLFVVTDVDGQARSLRAKTRPWSLLRPGALRGLRFTLGLFLVWTLFCAGLHHFSRNSDPNERALLYVIVSVAAYSVLYLSLALVVGRLPRSNRLSSPAAVRVLFFVLVGFASTLPPLFSLLMDMDGSDGLMNLLNPVVGPVNFGTHNAHTTGDKMTAGLLGFVVVVALLAAFAADRTLAEREKRAHAS
jgi:ABC-type transport system involved in multi-copper enzyme maturation permease subunit